MNKVQAVIQTQNLYFQWKDQPPVCAGVDLCVPAGSAFGLLGPNGVGKSTLFKLLLGLLPAQKGEISLLGVSWSDEKKVPLGKIGALIEEPPFYPHLSGWDNLRISALYQQLPLQRLEKVLQQAGLQAVADRKVRHYSTGMKQRLGIARALLAQPSLLLLDEPTNGLDPQGIAEIRTLLRRLNRDEGVTLLLSSHILSEIEQVCTDTAILYGGRLAYQGPIESLRRQTASHRFKMEVTQPAAALTLLEEQDWAAKKEEGNWIELFTETAADLDQVIDQLRAGGISIRQIKREENTLETAYLKILGDA